jgi:hypothetical protein
MAESAMSLRAALTRHPWVPGVLQSRPNPGPGNLRHNDAVLGALLRQAGFHLALTAHAVSAIDSYVLALQSLNMPIATPEQTPMAQDEWCWPTWRASSNAERALFPHSDDSHPVTT